MPRDMADLTGNQPQQEFVTITQEMKQWARGILETMNSVVASHGAEPSEEVMVVLGRIAFGTLGSCIPAETWSRYRSVIAESTLGTECRSRSRATSAMTATARSELQMARHAKSTSAIELPPPAR